MRVGRLLLVAIALLVLAAPVVAQEAAPAPQGSSQPGFLSLIQSTLGKHLGVAMLASYDWVAGDWEKPYAVGPYATWVVNDQLVITGGGKYILNSEDQHRWRSEIQVLVPIYGGERMR